MVLVSLASQRRWPRTHPACPGRLSPCGFGPGPQTTRPTLPIHWDSQGTVAVFGDSLGLQVLHQGQPAHAPTPRGSALCTPCVVSTALRPTGAAAKSSTHSRGFVHASRRMVALIL